MKVLEWISCKEGLNKPGFLSLEIRLFGGGSSLGNSLPGFIVNSKTLHKFRLNKYFQNRSFGDSHIEKSQQAQKITWAGKL